MSWKMRVSDLEAEAAPALVSARGRSGSAQALPTDEWWRRSLKSALRHSFYEALSWGERRLKQIGRRAVTGTTKNFLILQHQHALGTVLHTTPLLAALREAVPDCRIIVVASGMSREVYRADPDVEAVIETPDPAQDLWGAVLALRRRRPFGREHYCTLTPRGNDRSKVLLQSVLGGGWMRAGFTPTPEMYQHPLQFDAGQSLIANNLRIVAELGHPARHQEPRISVSIEDLEYARELLRQSGAAEGQPIAIFVTQTSVTQRKSWKAERFRAAAWYLHERYRAHVVFVGTEEESERIDAVRAGLSFPTASLAGKTNLLQLAAVLILGDVGLTLDTGTMHIGRAVGLPMVIVAPAWSPAIEWLPLDDPRFCVLKNMDLEGAPPDYVIDEVSVGEVTTGLADLLERYPPRTRPLLGAEIPEIGEELGETDCCGFGALDFGLSHSLQPGD